MSVIRKKTASNFWTDIRAILQLLPIPNRSLPIDPAKARLHVLSKDISAGFPDLNIRAGPDDLRQESCTCPAKERRVGNHLPHRWAAFWESRKHAPKLSILSSTDDTYTMNR